MPPRKGTSASCISTVCTACKFLGLTNCDGKLPLCSNCLHANRTCIYTSESDRRRRKYNGDYIVYLEKRIKKLETLIRKYDPEWLVRLQQTESQNFDQQAGESGIAQNRFCNLVAKFEEMDIDDGYDEEDDNTNTEGQREVETEYCYDEAGNMPYSFKYLESSDELLTLCEENCPDTLYCLKYAIPLLRKRRAISSLKPTYRSLMLAVCGYGFLFSKDQDLQKMGRSLIKDASDLVISASNQTLDLDIIQALLVLSCYEFGGGSDSMSYLFISMACSLTQHMGLHISYDSSNRSAAKFAPQIDSYQSAVLWSVCTQDRIVTNYLGVPACIHFKRIISPFYKVQHSPDEGDVYIEELCFSTTSRLWYILDRFTDQIFSVQSDLGDTQERTKLLHTAEESLKRLKEAFPSGLLLVDDQTCNGNFNFNAVCFQMNYEACIIILEKSFIGHSETAATSRCITAAIRLTKLSDLLLNFGYILKIPGYFGFLIYMAGIVHLVLCFQNKRVCPTHLPLLQCCIDVLNAHGASWKRSTGRAQRLLTLAEDHGIFLRRSNAAISEEDTNIQSLESGNSQGGGYIFEKDLNI